MTYVEPLAAGLMPDLSRSRRREGVSASSILAPRLFSQAEAPRSVVLWERVRLAGGWRRRRAVRLAAPRLVDRTWARSNRHFRGVHMLGPRCWGGDRRATALPAGSNSVIGTFEPGG